MNYQLKKKKFAYNVITNPPVNNPKDSRKTVFPDDFQRLTQVSKRIKLDDNINGGFNAKRKAIDIHNDGDDLMDDDFDFSQAVDEINEIELQASQMFPSSKANMPRFKGIQEQSPKTSLTQPTGRIKQFPETVKQQSDVLDELLASGSKGSSKNVGENLNESTFYLKIPKKKTLSNEAAETRDLSNGLPIKKFTVEKSEKCKSNYLSNTQVMFSSNSRKEGDSIELLNMYKSKMEEAEQKYLSKDGEIKILREKLRKLSESERQYRNEIHELHCNLKTQQSEKETKLLSDMEKLKTQLLFKEKEIQDALDRSKKTIVNNASHKASPSPKRSKSSFPSEGFEKNNKILQAISPSQRKSKQNERTFFQCKKFKNLFENNMRESSSHRYFTNELLKSSNIDYIKFKCDHSENGSNERNKSSFDNLTTLLELIAHNEFFIPEFVSKVSQYIIMFIELAQNMQIIKGKRNELTKENDNGNNNRIQNVYNGDARDCSICREAFESCVKGIDILNHGCLVYAKIKEYLLNGLVNFLGGVLKRPSDKSENISIDHKQYFTKYRSSSNILVLGKENSSIIQKEDIYNCKSDLAVHLWSSLDKLMHNQYFDNFNEALFKFHITLIPYPLSISSNFHVQYLVKHNLIYKYLTILSADRILNVITLLQKFIGIENAVELICNKSDSCVLLLIYNWLISDESDEELLTVFQQLISFLSSLIGFDHVLAYNFLLESECRCSNEIIECMITFLFDQFKYLQKHFFLNVENELTSSECKRLSCFRQGMAFLCLLCCNERNLVDKRSAVEWNYIHLFAGAIKMYRKIPSVHDKEVLDLEDLLDMDQYIDFDIAVDKMGTD